jgi:hypothetical protein
MIVFSALQLAQRRAVDAHRVAVMPQAAQQRFHHGPVSQKVGPLVIAEIGGNDAGMPPVALLDQFEKDIGLLRFQIQISKFVDKCSAEHFAEHF